MKQDDKCPYCGSTEVKISERTHSGIVYKIYICAGCGTVKDREYVPEGENGG